MSSMFRITPSLWDKIHHFASFPQTGGELVKLVEGSSSVHACYPSVSTTDGSFWKES